MTLSDSEITSCAEYDALPLPWKEQILKLIEKMKGKSWICGIYIEKSELQSYEFKISIEKWNTKRGWATIGYLRNDIFRGGIWRLTYNPRLKKGEKNEAGRTGSYS